MSKDNLKWGLYTEQGKKVGPEAKEAYDRTVYNLRRTYGIHGTMAHFHGQVLIDEIALSTIRINEAEHILRKKVQKGEADKELEKIAINLKDQRRKAIETLHGIFSGKRFQQQQAGKQSYRARMIRSKKFKSVLDTEKEVNAKEIGETLGVGPQEQEEEAGEYSN